MPTCAHCGRKWSWKQSLNRMFTLSQEIQCPHCHRNQFFSKKTRTINAVLNMFIVSPLAINIFFDLTPWMLLGMIVGIFLVLVVIFPFYLELDKEDRPLW
ncbi:hypothetical protein CEY16_11135 [Halalkalibacillus sediminis]|uniref:Cxxc_20_cxxc protein n=1 Tax=Halalkalibacillus sediminis TaxID=2018042 RepID=A0A2I0QSK3_9BACI|nr:hypothetical protein CEY16_11135 [Halalkalibacillus sediminis]